MFMLRVLRCKYIRLAVSMPDRQSSTLTALDNLTIGIACPLPLSASGSFNVVAGVFAPLPWE